jgi:hypothetical protein
MARDDSSYSGRASSMHAQESRFSLAARIAKTDFHRLAKVSLNTTRLLAGAPPQHGLRARGDLWLAERQAKAPGPDGSPRPQPRIRRFGKAAERADRLVRPLKGRATRLYEAMTEATQPARRNSGIATADINQRHDFPATLSNRLSDAPRWKSKSARPFVQPLPARVAGTHNSSEPLNAGPKRTTPRIAWAQPFTARIADGARAAIPRAGKPIRLRANPVGQRFMNGAALIARGAPERFAARLAGARGESGMAHRIDEALRERHFISFPNDHRALARASRGIANGGAPLSRLLMMTGPHRPASADGDRPVSASRRAALGPALAGSGESGGLIVNYSPNVTVNGGADVDNIDSLLIDAMRRHGHELAQILGREAAVRRRTKF